MRARSLSAREFAADDLVQDLILAAHVLYYVEDRHGVLMTLAGRLRPGGALSVVLRDQSCVTFGLRTAMRNAVGGDQTPKGAPTRITAAGAQSTMAEAGLSVRSEAFTFEIRIPASEVRYDDLVRVGPTSDETEFLRFLGHIDGAATDSRAVRAFVDELQKCERGGYLTLRFVDSVITGHRHPA
jgi:hypothetical protein